MERNRIHYAIIHSSDSIVFDADVYLPSEKHREVILDSKREKTENIALVQLK